jgi:hypothetical protein
MKNTPDMTTRLLTIACATLFALQGCKKETDSDAFTCPTTGVLYGYTGDSSSAAPYMQCSAGMIDLTTGAIAGTAAISSSTHFNQSAYNVAEDAYFSFGRGDTDNHLYKVSGASSTALSYTGTSPEIMDGLVYDRMHDKLLCFATSGTTSTLCEIVISGTSYITNSIVTCPEPMYNDISTADPSTGDIYFQTYDASTTQNKIRKYTYGSTGTPAVVYTGGAAIQLWGLRYNPNDNLLYALRPSPGIVNTFEFVKINPSTGSFAVIANLGMNINPKMLSATIDPCNDRYIFTSQDFTAPSPFFSFKMHQLSMTGAVISSMPIPHMYQGLDVRY